MHRSYTLRSSTSNEHLICDLEIEKTLENKTKMKRQEGNVVEEKIPPTIMGMYEYRVLMMLK